MFKNQENWPIIRFPSPTPPISSSDFEIETPPDTIRTLSRSIKKISKRLDNEVEEKQLSPSLRRQIDLIFKANIRHTETASQLASDLQQHHFQAKKRTKDRNSRRQIPVVGRLSGYHGKRHVARRDQQELYSKLRVDRRFDAPPELPYVQDPTEVEAENRDYSKLPDDAIFSIDTEGQRVVN